LHPSTEQFLLDHYWDIDNVFVIGSDNIISSEVWDDIYYSVGTFDVWRLYHPSNDNRYNTSLIIAIWFFQGNPLFTDLAFATGKNFPDALMAGPYGAREFAPVMLVEGASVTQEILDWLDFIDASSNEGYLFGNNNVITNDLRSELNDHIMD